MKKQDVEINSVYAAKVSGKLAPVRILSVGNFNANGWNGRNVTTGKKVFIKSAGRLRFKLVFHDGQWRKCVPAIVDARLNRKPEQSEVVFWRGRTWEVQRTWEGKAAYEGPGNLGSAPDAIRLVEWGFNQNVKYVKDLVEVSPTYFRTHVQEEPCRHQYEEQPGEPAQDVCVHCGDVRY